MRYFSLLYSFCLITTIANSQNGKPDIFAKEISFTNENDAYLLKGSDAYYTNGIFLALRTAREKKGRKIVNAYELGQMIYTPLIRKTTGPEDIDRPYCGYLYLHYTQTQFYHKSVLQYSGGVGEVGTDSFGENVQNSYHKLLGYSRFSGWQYQVQNALGIDMGISYAHTLFEDSSWIKLMPVVQANLGSTFTNAKLGAYLCLGSFENNTNSALWNARVQTKNTETRKNHELFLYWYPQLILQGYNATVQGGLFNKGTGAVLKDLQNLMFQQSFGLCYAEGKWTTNFAIVYQTKEAVTQKRAQEYGSLLVSYRLH